MTGVTERTWADVRREKFLKAVAAMVKENPDGGFRMNRMVQIVYNQSTIGTSARARLAKELRHHGWERGRGGDMKCWGPREPRC